MAAWIKKIWHQVTILLTGALGSPRQLSIFDLKGLGKEHLGGLDAAEHVAKERATWD